MMGDKVEVVVVYMAKAGVSLVEVVRLEDLAVAVVDFVEVREEGEVDCMEGATGGEPKGGINGGHKGGAGGIGGAEGGS